MLRFAKQTHNSLKLYISPTQSTFCKIFGTSTKKNKFLDSIKHIAEERKISLAQLVINWTIQQPGITSVLVGLRNPEQVQENVKATDFMLNGEEMNIINRELEKLELHI